MRGLIYKEVFPIKLMIVLLFFFSSRRRHTRSDRDWSSDVCSSDLHHGEDHDLLHDDGARAPRRRSHRAGRPGPHRRSHVPARAHGIGYLAQEPSVFRKLTVEQNLLAILETLPLTEAQRAARLEQLLDEL